MTVFASMRPRNTDPFPRQSHTFPEPDPAWDEPQHNRPNPILVRFRKWIEGEDLADLFWAAYWTTAFDEFDAFGGFKTWDEPGHPLNVIATADDAERTHARRVLTRLATLAGPE